MRITVPQEVVAVVLGIALVVGSVIGYYTILPWFYGQQFKAVRQSNPYVTTQQTALVQLYNSYTSLETKKRGADPGTISAMEAQQAAIILQMRQVAILIPGNVPPEIQGFLAVH